MAAPNVYSTIVAWVKIILPLVALGLLSTLFLFSGRPDPEDAIIFSEANIEELARDQRLGSPRFAGTLEDGREILFSAEAAAPVVGEPNRFTAQSISARLELDATDFAVLHAVDAAVDMGMQEATLSGGVDIWRTDGMQLTTQQLIFGLDRLSATAPGPVRAEGRGILLEAGAMTLSEANGPQVLSFTGGVRVIYQAQP